MAERVLMLSEGYDLYSELPCDQAPGAFLIGAAAWGDVVSLRALTAVFSMLAIASCMYASRRIAGAGAMLVTGALLAVDFTFLRESRLFSLDALAASVLAVSLLAFIMYQHGNRLPYLVASGLLIGLSASMKLLGVVGLAGMLLFIVLEMTSRRSDVRTSAVAAVTMLVCACVPMVVLLLLLGPTEMLEGMVFNQGHRTFDAFLKLSVVAFFGLCIAYALPLVRAKALWRAGPAERLLLCVTVAVLLFMVLQPLVFLHHMAFASPALAILAGVAISREIGPKSITCNDDKWLIVSKLSRGAKAAVAILVASVAVSGGLSMYGLLLQDEPIQVEYGRVLAELTDEDDWVICGDPLIAAYADRRVPPEVVNVAYRQYPELTFDTVRTAVVEYDVAAVVVCYHLNDFEGLPGFLESHGYTQIDPSYFAASDDAALDLFQEGIDPLSFYVRGDLVVLLSAALESPVT